MRPGGPPVWLWQACLAGSLGLHAALLASWPEDAAKLGEARDTRPVHRALLLRQLSVSVPKPKPAPTVSPEVAPEILAEPAPSPSPQAHLPAEEVYLPRKQLDTPPQLRSLVELLWPEDGPPAGQYRDVLAVYIDEQGVVRRVRFEAGSLPEQLQEIARSAFMNARFTPGLLQGQPVKSWIRLEVNFDADARVSTRGARR